MCHPKTGTQMRPEGLCEPRPPQAPVCADVQWATTRSKVKNCNFFLNLFYSCLPLNSCKLKTDGWNLVGAGARLLHMSHLVPWNLLLLPDETETSSRAVRYPAATASRDREGAWAMRGCLHSAVLFTIWSAPRSRNEALFHSKLYYNKYWMDSELPSVSEEWVPQAAGTQCELPVVSDICGGTAKQDCHFAGKKQNFFMQAGKFHLDLN